MRTRPLPAFICAPRARPSAWCAIPGSRRRSFARRSSLAAVTVFSTCLQGCSGSFRSCRSRLPLPAFSRCSSRTWPPRSRRSLEDVESFGKSYDLCGPRVYTLRELVEMRKRNHGPAAPDRRVERCHVVCAGVRDGAPPFKQILRALDMLMTRDNYYSMKVDSVCRCEFPFGIAPTALEGVAAAYWVIERRVIRKCGSGRAVTSRQEPQRRRGAENDQAKYGISIVVVFTPCVLR